MHVPLAGQSMLAEVKSVVGREDDDRIIEQVFLLKCGNHPTHQVVDTGDQTVIVFDRFLKEFVSVEANLPAFAGSSCII